MVCTNLQIAAWFILGMFLAALNAKALGVSVVYAIALMALYPDCDGMQMVVLLYIPAYLLAAFRD